MPPAVLLPAAILGAGALGAGASIFASNAQSTAQKNALNQQQALFNTGLTTAQNAAQPFINFGQSMVSPLTSLLTPGPDQTSTLEKLPGYQFNLSQGEKAVTNQATMTGLSGNALRAGADYASGLAGNTFSDLVNKLLTATNIGSTSASSLGSTVMGGVSNAANTQGNSIANIGNAQAAGITGAANSITGATNNVASLATLNALTGNKLFQGTGSMYGQPQQLGPAGPGSGDSLGIG